MNRVVETETERKMLVKYIDNQPLPITVNVRAGKHRTNAQNRLINMWYKEIAEQRGDMTFDEVRAECKLMQGVPIRREEEDFRMAYDPIFKNKNNQISVETKLKLMVEPFDFAITRDMTTVQLTKYTEAMQKHWAEQGIILTDPDDQGRE